MNIATLILSESRGCVSDRSDTFNCGLFAPFTIIALVSFGSSAFLPWLIRHTTFQQPNHSSDLECNDLSQTQYLYFGKFIETYWGQKNQKVLDNTTLEIQHVLDETCFNRTGFQQNMYYSIFSLLRLQLWQKNIRLHQITFSSVSAHNRAFIKVSD